MDSSILIVIQNTNKMRQNDIYYIPKKLNPLLRVVCHFIHADKKRKSSTAILLKGTMYRMKGATGKFVYLPRFNLLLNLNSLLRLRLYICIIIVENLSNYLLLFFSNK